MLDLQSRAALNAKIAGAKRPFPIAEDDLPALEAKAILGPGYASFPTPPNGLAVRWERALALVDTALYLAKAHGRNLAYGVSELHARDESELVEISHRLEASWRDGRVQLSAQRGPAAVVTRASGPRAAAAVDHEVAPVSAPVTATVSANTSEAVSE